MGVFTEISQNCFELEDSGNFTFHCNSSPSLDEYTCTSPDSVFEHKIPMVTTPVCYGCSGDIEDQYILRMNDQSWHPSCLRCSHCHTILDNHSTCYVRGGNIYCRKEEYGLPCGKCNGIIRNEDWVRQAQGINYHLACFSCDVCHRQLPTGEDFALHNNRLLCKAHYLQDIRGESQPRKTERTEKRRSKRMRTAFTEEQIQLFQFYFNVEQNPDPEDLDNIAEQAGVVRRVAQVWFQNARARSKRNTLSSASSPVSDSSKESNSAEHSFESLEDLIQFN